MNKARKSIIKFQSIGLLLFGLYVVSTYLAQDVILPASYNTLFLYLFLGWGILNVFFAKRLRINAMAGWMLVVMGFSLLTMVYSPNKSIFTGQFYLLIVNFTITLFLSRISFDRREVLLVCWVYVLSAAALTLLLMATGNMSDSTGRLGNEVFGNANTMAFLLMLAVMYAFFLMVYFSNAVWKKALLILCVALSYYAMFLSGGRKFIVIPIVFLYALLMLKVDKAGKKHIIKYTAIIAVMVFILYQLIMNVPAFYDVMGKRIEGLFNLFSGGGTVELSAAERNQMAQMGLQQWTHSPILGYGFDSFKYYNQKMTGHFYYSHNNYVELLYDLGLIGFILYYAFYFKLLKTGLFSKAVPMYARAFSVATAVSFLVYEFGAINYSSTPAMIMLAVAFAMQGCDGKTDQGDICYE